MQVRGRHLVIAWTAVFLAVAGIITVRDHHGWQVRGRLAAVRDSVEAARSEVDLLKSRVSFLTSRAHLAPIATALGLRISSDSEYQRLTLPGDH